MIKISEFRRIRQPLSEMDAISTFENNSEALRMLSESEQMFCFQQ